MTYDWTSDVENTEKLFSGKDLFNFRKKAAQRIAENNPAIPVAEAEEKIWEGKIKVYAIRADSMLYQLLEAWYGKYYVLDMEVKNAFYYHSSRPIPYFCFCTDESSDFLDKDLLGGDGDGSAKRRFEDYVGEFLTHIPTDPGWRKID